VIVALAGSTVHFLIALLLLFVLNTVVGVTDVNKPLLQVDTVEALTKGPSPAQLAGFKHGDVIEQADGQTFRSFDDLRTYIQNNPGKPITFAVRRGGQDLTLVATPVDLSNVQPKGAPAQVNKPTGFLGIAPAFARVKAPNPVVGAGRSVVQLGRFIGLTVKAIGSIFSPHGISSIGHQVFNPGNTTSTSPNAVRPISPVGIVHVTNQAVKRGIEPVLELLMGINIFIGVFNLIPLPPFDGGLVAVAIYERIRSRRGHRYEVDMTRMLPVAYAVFMVLIFIFVSALYLDLTRPL
jgi:membrane-associated protease RseP (regulator of RpoE activity)